MLLNWFRVNGSQNSVSTDTFEDEAVVAEIVRQKELWRVEYQGSWWTARSIEPLFLVPGSIVRVVGRQGITLIIKPCNL